MDAYPRICNGERAGLGSKVSGPFFDATVTLLYLVQHLNTQPIVRVMDNPNTCPICICGVRQTRQVVSLGCCNGAIFHRNCIGPMLLTTSDPRCPLCRSPIDGDEGLNILRGCSAVVLADTIRDHLTAELQRAVETRIELLNMALE